MSRDSGWSSTFLNLEPRCYRLAPIATVHMLIAISPCHIRPNPITVYDVCKMSRWGKRKRPGRPGGFWCSVFNVDIGIEEVAGDEFASYELLDVRYRLEGLGDAMGQVVIRSSNGSKSRPAASSSISSSLWALPNPHGFIFSFWPKSANSLACRAHSPVVLSFDIVELIEENGSEGFHGFLDTARKILASLSGSTITRRLRPEGTSPKSSRLLPGLSRPISLIWNNNGSSSTSYVPTVLVKLFLLPPAFSLVTLPLALSGKSYASDSSDTESSVSSDVVEFESEVLG